MTPFVIPMTNLGFHFDIELSGWQQKLTAFHRFSDDQKEPLEGGLGLSIDAITRQVPSANRWLAEIPANYLQITAQFPEYQYQMLWLVANCTQAQHLLNSRPLLLALICVKHHIDNHKALQIAQLEQHDILQSLGLDSSQAAFEFIDKLDLDYSNNLEIQPSLLLSLMTQIFD